MGAGKTCLTSTEFALDNRQLSIVLHVEGGKTMLCVSSGVVTRLVRSYLLPFYKRCLSFVLVDCNI